MGGVLFFFVTAVVVWFAQLALAHLPLLSWTAPHLLLLTVAALGTYGRTGHAQTLGLVWGLALDVNGVSLFGAQGLMLAGTGYVAGVLSRQINADKLVAQEVVSVSSTIAWWLGIRFLESVFRQVPRADADLLPALVPSLLLNALAAPLVFWAVGGWLIFWRRSE